MKICIKMHWNKGYHYFLLLGWLSSKESTFNAGDTGSTNSIPGLGRSHGEGNGNPYQYSCLENPHGQRSLTGYSLKNHKESDTTETLSTYFLPDRKIYSGKEYISLSIYL